MAIGLNDDDFHKLPEHVKEQIRQQLGESQDDLERDTQAVLDKHEREAAARQNAAEASWNAEWEAGLAQAPIGAERPPQSRARLPEPSDTPGRMHHAVMGVVIVLLVMAVFIGLYAPAEVAALPILVAIALVGIVVAVR